MPRTADRVLPPAEIDCKWWKQGYCARGKTCYFRHDEAMAGVDNKKPVEATRGKRDGKVETRTNLPATVSASRDVPSSALDRGASSSTRAQMCTICLENPDTFGLLLNCDHCFCLECIRNWRSSTTAPQPSDEELKPATKTCPMCRAHSDYIIPSSQFPVSPSQGEENTAKKAIVDRYLSRLQNIPCRYFEQSVEDTMPDFRPKCKFGNSCHYAHRHPLSKEPYIFSDEEINRSRRRRRPRQPRYDPAVELAVMESLIAGLSFYDSDDLLDDMGCEFDDDLALFESGDLGFSFGAEFDFEEDEFEGYYWD